MEYDIVYCNDGVTRAVPVVKGTPQDPSIGSLKVVKEEKVKPEKPKISIQDRINEQVSTLSVRLKVRLMILLIVILKINMTVIII